MGDNFVPPLLEAVLIDYQRNVPAARDPEVLSTMATIVNKLGAHITTEIPKIFDAVFECTLNMINKVGMDTARMHVTLLRKCTSCCCSVHDGPVVTGSDSQQKGAGVDDYSKSVVHCSSLTSHP